MSYRKYKLSQSVFAAGAVFVMTIWCVLTACSPRWLDSESRVIVEKLEKYWKEKNFGKADSLGKILYNIAMDNGDSLMVAQSLYYSSGYDGSEPDSVGMHKIAGLQRALEIANAYGDNSLQSRIYNQLGVWETLRSGAFYTSKYYFAQSIAAAKRANNREVGIPAEFNLSELFRMTGDTLGYSHDIGLLKYAKQAGDVRLRSLAALHCALYKVSTANDTTELRPFIDAIDDTGEFSGTIDMLYARFFSDRQRYKEAEKYILRTDTAGLIDYKILHGEIERGLGNLEASNRILLSALNSIEARYPQSAIQSIRIHDMMSQNYHELGDDSRAWEHRFASDSERDRADSLSEIDRMERYRVEYEVMRQDYELVNNKLRINRLNYTLILMVTILVLGSLGVTYYIRRRNRLYREIVSKYMEITDTGEVNSGTGEEDGMPDEVSEPVEEKRNRQSDEKSAMLYKQVVDLMETDRLWSDKTISRDVLSAKVGCNRTYLTDALRLHAGMSYTQFITHYRIREAVRVLSNPADDVPLKRLSDDLGFSSISTFYSAFRDKTGMSPAQYRRTAREISADKHIRGNENP